MKKIFLLIAFVPLILLGQDGNYVITKVYKDPITTPFINPQPIQATTTVTYYDGLGRPMQKRAFKQSPMGTDIVTPMEYDVFGRQEKEYLPYAGGATLNYDPNAIGDALLFYDSPDPLLIDIAPAANPYAMKQFDPSPLNTILRQASPGNSWAMDSGHEIKYEYYGNVDDEVKLFKVSVTDGSLSQDNGSYGKNLLYKTITKNENWVPADELNNTVEEFKDMQGKVILKRTYNDGDKHDTYYVYDIYGNLTYVIPPIVLAEFNISTQILDKFCYQYTYDFRNRLISKKLPGKQSEYIIYDRLDRPVATGPALNPFDGSGFGWMITKYDSFDRIVYTGWISMANFSTSAINDMRGAIDSSTAVNEEKTDTVDNTFIFGINYTHQVIPVSGFKILTVNYYDDYNFPNAPLIFLVGPTVLGQATTIDVKGLQTGNWVRTLTDATNPIGALTYLLYDMRSRIVSSTKTWLDGGFTTTYTKFNFAGQVLQTQILHDRSSHTEYIRTDDLYSYTDQGRPADHIHIINDGTPELISHNEYDVMGNIKSKRVGGADVQTFEGLQDVDYKYNIRGWLTNINNTDDLADQGIPDLFAFKINYDATEDNVDDMSPLYNGNISETYWRTSGDNIRRKYSYQYDNLNRLKNAVYQKPDADIQVTHSYDENLMYDKNGNITHLDRNGNLDNLTMNVPIDNLDYSYNANQLMRVHDNTNSTLGFKDEATAQGGFDTVDDYAYDGNGNMIRDDNKGITSITYNHLNLPIEIVFNNNQNTKITYIYNAAGQKLQKIAKTSATVTRTTDYLDGFQYLNNKLAFFPTTEGYVNNTVVNDRNVYNYVYNYVDHLGNIRLSYGLDPKHGDLEILEENHYYPFGLKHTNYNTALKVYGKEDNGESVELKPGAPPEDDGSLLPKSLYKYKYNGKEYQDELGLNQYDYGSRNYDPAIGRWMNIDPLAETSRRFSPYIYALNNPVFFIDPDGMEALAADKVIITGDAAKQATQDLDNSSSLNITRDDNGELHATGKAETKADRALLKAINSTDVTVNLEATNTNEPNGQPLLVGSFKGNTKNADGTVSASTSVNPNQATTASGFYGTPAGVYVEHEILESYNAAVDSPGAKAPTKQEVDNKLPNAMPYLNAHYKAMNQNKNFVEPNFLYNTDDNTWNLTKTKDIGNNVNSVFKTTLYKPK